MIRRYAAAVSSLAATSPTKTSNNDIGDSSPNISANTQIGELEQEPGRVDVAVVETESSDARKVPIRSPSPSSFVPPLPMSAAVPLSSEQVLTLPTSPTATTTSSSSSRVQATASSSVHPLHLMRPPNKRDRHGRGVFDSSPHDPKFRGIDPSSNHRLDENDNLRLLAETADSISSENSYSVGEFLSRRRVAGSTPSSESCLCYGVRRRMMMMMMMMIALKSDDNDDDDEKLFQIQTLTTAAA